MDGGAAGGGDGLLASINSYAQLFETLTDQAANLEARLAAALAEHEAVRLEHLALQATKFGLASTAAAQQASLIGQQLAQVADASALRDSALAVSQLELVEAMAARQLNSTQCFSARLVDSFEAPASAETVECTSLERELQLLVDATSSARRELELASLAERGAVARLAEAAAGSQLSARKLAQAEGTRRNAEAALAAMRQHEAVARGRAVAATKLASERVAEESRVDVEAEIAAAAAEELEQQLRSVQGNGSRSAK